MSIADRRKLHTRQGVSSCRRELTIFFPFWPLGANSSMTRLAKTGMQFMRHNKRRNADNGERNTGYLHWRQAYVNRNTSMMETAVVANSNRITSRIACIPQRIAQSAAFQTGKEQPHQQVSHADIRR